MALSVNRINQISFRAGETSQKKSEPEKSSQETTGMSDGEKILIGLGATATAVIGGILIKKRIDAKSAEKLAQKAAQALQKPETFSLDIVRKLADEWNNAGKIADGDEVILMGKSLLDELAKGQKSIESGWSKFYKAMNMSENGFAIIVRKADKSVDTSTIKYFDPKTNTELLIVDSIKNNKICVMPIED